MDLRTSALNKGDYINFKTKAGTFKVHFHPDETVDVLNKRIDEITGSSYGGFEGISNYQKIK